VPGRWSVKGRVEMVEIFMVIFCLVDNRDQSTFNPSLVEYRKSARAVRWCMQKCVKMVHLHHGA